MRENEEGFFWVPLLLLCFVMGSGLIIKSCARQWQLRSRLRLRQKEYQEIRQDVGLDFDL